MLALMNRLEEVDKQSDQELFASEDLRRIGYLPSPEEITTACATIRSNWTLSEKRRRFVGEQMPDEPDIAWRPPTIDTSYFQLSHSLDIDS